MTLDLGFWAEDEAEARTAATDWLEAEPAVESGRIVGVQQQPEARRWTVTVELRFWPSYEQIDLRLPA